jgi:virulence factor
MKHTIAVIGLGGIAQNAHLPVLAAMPGIELCLYSRTHEKVKRIAEQYRIGKWTTKFEELLSWKVENAYILSPTTTHAELLTICLNENMDIFVEKPATSNYQDTLRVAELADKKKRIVMVAFNRRYAPLTIRAKEIWGKRRIVLANFQKSRTKPYFKGLYNQISEEHVHTVDTLRFLCGEVKVLRTEARLDNEESVVGLASLLKLENGGIAQITASLNCGHWYENYELNGDGATLNLLVNTDLHFTQEEVTQSWKEPYDSSWNSGLFGRGFVGEIQHFLHCIETREQPQTNLWDSLKTQELVEAIYSSAKLS